MALIRWTTQSLDDIDAIAEYISKDSLKYAAIQVNRFFERVTILEKEVYIGRIVPELNDKSIRELLLGNYRIIYSVVSESEIHIITVHHSRRLLVNNPAFRKNDT